MEKRDPIKLRIPLVLYNAIELSANLWLFYEFSATGWLTGKYSYFCQPVDISFSPDAVWVNIKNLFLGFKILIFYFFCS